MKQTVSEHSDNKSGVKKNVASMSNLNYLSLSSVYLDADDFHTSTILIKGHRRYDSFFSFITAINRFLATIPT